MILLDTHAWIWWVNADPRLPRAWGALLDQSDQSLGVSVISCLEVAQLVSKGRIGLNRPTLEWVRHALAKPRVRLVHLTPSIAVEANQLPGTMHGDPADRILVATARLRRVPLLTADRKILAYSHVPLAQP